MINVEQDDDLTRVRCRYVRFDGVRFGTTRTTIHIHDFHGDRLVTDLPIYPLGFHADPKLEETLAERGLRALEYQGISYQQYDGSAKAVEEEDEEEYDARGELRSYRVSSLVLSQQHELIA